MNYKIYFLILFCFVSLSSCESMISDLDEDKLPKIESKLVVECYISPQSEEIKVMVTEPQRLYGPANFDPVYIKNASVIISGEAGQITIPYNDSTSNYIIKASAFKIESGKKYSLVVSDGKRTVRASCTVPATSATVKNYVIQPVTESRYPGDSSANVKMSWEDIKGEPNYYALRGYSEIEQKTYSFNAEKEIQITTQRTKRVFNSNYEDFLYTDTNIDGITFNSPVYNVSLYKGNIGYIDKNGKPQTLTTDPILKEIYFEILNMDENYYKFCKTIKANGNSDNPFVEPALIYTNIIGGLGCFGAFNAGSLRIKY